MWPLKTLAFFGLFWLTCLMALVNPIWGLINYIIVYQVNPNVKWWGIPLRNMGIRFSLLAFAFTALGLFLGNKRIPKFKPTISLWEIGIATLVLFGLTNMVLGLGDDLRGWFGREDEYSWLVPLVFDKLWKMMLFVLILGRLAASRRNLTLVLWALAIGSLNIGVDALNAPRSAFRDGRLNDIGGIDFLSTSGAAGHLTAMLPLIGVLFLISRGWISRGFAAVCAAFTCNAIIMCRTRSAFIGMACGALAAMLLAPKARRFRIHLLLAIGAICAFALTDGYFWNRMATLTHPETLVQDRATLSRTAIWGISLQILADNPHGVGPGNFPQVIGWYSGGNYSLRSSHNTFLVCLVELGVQGGAVFLFLVVASFTFLHRSVKLADRTDRPLETRMLAYGMTVSLVTYLVLGMGTERFYTESFWWVLVLPLCLHRTTSTEARVNAEEPLLAVSPALPAESVPHRRLDYGY